MDVGVRLVRPDDARVLAGLLRENRAFLAPWEPLRDDAYFTEQTQRAAIEQALTRSAQGLMVPYVVTADGVLVGRINVNDVVRGAFQSAHLGYWVGRAAGGRGVATAAVAEVVRLAFTDLGLHRLEASTLVHNVASRRVLARNGFTEIGFAPAYLRIAGRWQDSLLHQRVTEDWREPGSR